MNEWMCMFTVWYPIEFSRLHNLHPWYYNSVLYGLISSGENSVHFLQQLPFTILHCSFHQVPITAGWTEAAWYKKACPTPLHMAGNVTRASVTHPRTNRARHCLASVIWRELVTTRPCATTYDGDSLFDLAGINTIFKVTRVIKEKESISDTEILSPHNTKKHKSVRNKT